MVTWITFLFCHDNIVLAINKIKRRKEDVVFITENDFPHSHEMIIKLVHQDLSRNKMNCRRGNKSVKHCYNWPSASYYRNSLFVQYFNS